MRFDPQDPIWPNRDRFVLSNGHASMLLWAVPHLIGTQAVISDYEIMGQPAVSLDDIRRFRQLNSKAPGHPEYRWVSGVETTTGPLGQGAATSVGMAIAQKWLAARYNRPGFDMFDYNIYAVCGDGCMMEGVASEAASLAGHLSLDNLCWIYDNNHITIEGSTSIAFTEDIAARFLGYGWNVLRVGDANDIDLIEHALGVFQKTKGRPTFIILDSHIGYGSPHKAIPGLVTLRPGDANEVVEAYRYVMRLRHQPAVLALSRQPPPTFDRSKYAPASGVAPRCLCPCRRSRREPGADPDRFGQRDLSRRPGPRTADRRGYPLARSLDAVLGHLRTPDTRIPGQRAAARCKGPRRSGAGFHLGMGALRRSGGPRHRYAHLRRLGSAQGTPEKVRLRAGPRRAVAKELLAGN
jgi:transketolase N-terminal domain/subunit